MSISQLNDELSEMRSKLMMRETELIEFKEKNKQLMKQLSNKKQRESVSQVMF